MKKTFLLLFMATAFMWANAANTYYSQGSVTFNTFSNWNTNRLGGGSSPSNFTTSGDIFIVQGNGNGGTSPHSMTITGASVTLGSGVTLQIENGANVTATNALSVNAAAFFIIDAGGTFTQNNTGSWANLLGGTETFATTSNFIVTSSGSTGPGTPANGGFGNFTYNAASGNVNSAGTLTAIKGNLTLGPSATGEFRLTGNTALTLTVGGNIDLQGGTLDLGNGSASPVVNLGGNFSMTGGNLNYIGSGASGATINFTKAGTQTFTKTAGTITAATASSRSINFVVKSGSTLDMGTNVLDNAALSTVNFTVDAGGGLITANAGGIAATGATGSIQTTTGARNFNVGANYTYNGSVAQVTGTGLTGANDLIINNTSGATPAVTLTNAISVTGTLTLTAGKVSLGANNITVAGLSGGSATSYLTTDGAGKVIRNAGATAVAFPIGTSASYAPLTIDNSAGTADDFSVSIEPRTSASTPAPSVANFAKVLLLQYDVAEGTAGGSNATLTFQWNGASDEGASMNRATGLVAAHYTGGAWIETAATAVGSGPYTASLAGVTTFSPFSLGNAGAFTGVILPVSAISLKAFNSNANTELRWNVIGNDVVKFVVESSNDGSNFQPITTVFSTGNNSNYSYIDAAANAGIVYYRIKMISGSGNTKYSSIIAVNSKRTGGMTVQANPVRDQLLVAHEAAGNNAALTIVSMNGSKLSTYVPTRQSIQSNINIGALAPGIYMLRYENNGVVVTKRFVKM